jgi:hypothetical protein
MNRVPTPGSDERREKSPQPVPDAFTLHWRIYYADGVYVSSNECPWEQAPSKHIVAVVHAINDEPATCELGTPYYWHHGDWIARVWDPTLYLRQTGLVKFGRWASFKLFNDAWRQALASLDSKVASDQAMRSGMVFNSTAAKPGESGTTWALYYDDSSLVNSTQFTWQEAPTDGVLCATYSCVYTGAKFSAAIRRYTYYYWQGHQLQNTDDLDEVLTHFPQCKQGQPSFTGKSYRHQGEALSAALKDDLGDLR